MTDNYNSYLTGTVAYPLEISETAILYTDSPEIISTKLGKEKETKEKKMTADNQVVSAPYIFDTTLGQMNVQFVFVPNYALYLNDDSRKRVVRDYTEARLTNHPLDTAHPAFIAAAGYSIRRPSENQNKTAARLYALANAVKNGYTSNNRQRAVLVGYLKSLGMNNDFCNLIIGDMRVL